MQSVRNLQAMLGTNMGSQLPYRGRKGYDADFRLREKTIIPPEDLILLMGQRRDAALQSGQI